MRIEQSIGNGQSTVGTGFVVTSSGEGGTPRTILITANHVFAEMPHQEATVGFRERDQSGVWRYAPLRVRIRYPDGRPSWTRHPTHDVAVVELPATLSHAAVPAGELPGERALETLNVQPGDEMMVLGYPRGLSANPQGFPILSGGKVASYPLSPADRYPTYLVNMNVHAGNSGGPVYMILPGTVGAAAQVIVTGVLTQQIKYRGDRLAIGNVTQADFISETMMLIDSGDAPEVSPGHMVRPKGHAVPAKQESTPTWLERLQMWWSDIAENLRIFFIRTWIVFRDGLYNWTTPDPRPSPAAGKRA